MSLEVAIHDALSVPIYGANCVKYCELPTPWTHLEINPYSIRQSIEPSSFVRSGRYRFSGLVMANGWDRVIELPVKHRVFPYVFKAVFADDHSDADEAMVRVGLPAQDAEIFKSLFACGLKERFSELFTSLKRTGFKHASFIKGGFDPFFVCIDEHGDFLFTTGKHRLALVKAVGLDAMTVRVSARHIGWIRYRNEFLERLKSDRLTDHDRSLWAHPDLQDLIRRAGHSEA